jgi:hypothetical protein
MTYIAALLLVAGVLTLVVGTIIGMIHIACLIYDEIRAAIDRRNRQR